VTFVLGVAVFLAIYNNLANVVGIPEWLYVPANLALACALVAAGRAQGFRWDTMGLARTGVVPGLRWGLAGGVVVAFGLAVAVAWPPAAPFLADERVAGLSVGALAFRVLVRIPLGTAVLEEVAFRGVLFGAWAQARSVRAAVTGSSAVFGLWHIGPTIVLLAENEVTLGAGGLVLAVTGSVAATTVAGVVFCGLRLRSGGIVAPALVHVATNSLGTLAAFWAQRV